MKTSDSVIIRGYSIIYNTKLLLFLLKNTSI
ncbi:hypothetical protein SAMN05421827_11431 [Pedobacter terrae]|uniref:Uncharacterized protein n=1 Tax=Pedobacter terrae TaxID=405671 RepID=A0A1G7YNV1_9SPHI|nr:hypothetical protein SAMN05421827_11431 [Pedobacter terrae]